MPNPSARGLANLRPFRPGQSGNPKGRPRGSGALKTMLRAALDACPPGSEKTYLETRPTLECALTRSRAVTVL